jgi:hypothetical protein
MSDDDKKKERHSGHPIPDHMPPVAKQLVELVEVSSGADHKRADAIKRTLFDAISKMEIARETLIVALDEPCATLALHGCYEQNERDATLIREIALNKVLTRKRRNN